MPEEACLQARSNLQVSPQSSQANLSLDIRRSFPTAVPDGITFSLLVDDIQLSVL